VKLAKLREASKIEKVDLLAMDSWWMVEDFKDLQAL
jgi:hypothetical protein